jgi:hypothetical protein
MTSGAKPIAEHRRADGARSGRAVSLLESSVRLDSGRSTAVRTLAKQAIEVLLQARVKPIYGVRGAGRALPAHDLRLVVS